MDDEIRIDGYSEQELHDEIDRNIPAFNFTRNGVIIENKTNDTLNKILHLLVAQAFKQK